MSTYTPNDAAGIPSGYSVPDDGTPRNAASILVALEGIADAVAYIARRRLTRVNDLTALAALTGMQDKDRAYVDFDGRGWYSFVLGASVALTDGLWAVAAGDGSGVWIAAGFKLHPVREVLVAAPATPFSTSSAGYVNATGWSVSSKGIAGDRIVARFDGQIASVSGTAYRYAQLTIVDPNGTPVDLVTTERRSNSNVLQEAGYDVGASYTLVGTGTYTVVLKVHCDGTNTVSVEADSTLTVTRCKP